MNTIKLLLLTFAAAIFLAACQPPANNSAPANSNANYNANANRAATAAAPTKDALLALDRSAFEAWKNKDTKFWDTFISSRFAAVEPSGKIDKAEVLKHFADDKCEVKSYSISDDQMTPLGTDAALLTYKASTDATCGGKPEPPNAWAATLYVREGDGWKAVFHGENPIPAAGSDNANNANAAKPAAPAPKPVANSNANANTNSAAARRAHLFFREPNGPPTFNSQHYFTTAISHACFYQLVAFQNSNGIHTCLPAAAEIFQVRFFNDPIFCA